MCYQVHRQQVYWFAIMRNLAADRNTLLRKAPRTLDSLSGHACQLTLEDLTFFVRTLIQTLLY